MWVAGTQSTRDIPGFHNIIVYLSDISARVWQIRDILWGKEEIINDS